MEHTAKPKVRRNNRAQILAMILVGGGLLIFGMVALIMLPRGGQAKAGSEISAVPVQVNYPAPALALTDLLGNPVSLEGLAGKGNVVLVNNWATWCPPCKAEMPVLEAFFKKHQDEGFMIVAIESGEPVEQVKDFVTEYGLTFNVWPDLEGQALAAFRNDALPSSYVIDKTGTVRLAWTGQVSRKMLDQYVTPLLEE